MAVARGGLPRPVRVLLSTLTGLAAWQFVATSGVVPRNALPSLGAMVDAVGEVLADGLLWRPMWDTLLGASTGLLIATVVAVPLGIALGSSRVLHTATNGTLEFLRPVPPPALIPVAVLVLGTGFETKTALVAIGCFFPLLVQCIEGVRSIDPMMAQTAGAFRITRTRTFLQVTLPAVLPNVFTGLRISASIALLVAVAVEVIVGTPGLGRAITLAANAGLPAQMNVFVVASGVLGIVVNAVFLQLQRRTVTWVGRGREVEA